MREQLFRISIKQLLLISLIICVSHVSFSQNYKTVKAQKGDGVFSLLKRHGLPASEFKHFLELNKENLRKNNELVIGRTYKLPIEQSATATVDASPSKGASTSGGTVVVHKIFGPKNERITIVDSQLKGAVYYLLSGHGGPDPGAVGKLNGHILCEDEYAYDVTLRLAKNLIEHGADVYLITRDPNDGIRDDQYLKPDKDEVCYPNLRIPARQMTRLTQRKDAINKLYLNNKGRFQRQIVIHVDSRSRGENIDVFFYYDQRSNTGKKLAENLQQTFDEKYRLHQPGRGYRGSISTRNLFVIKYSYPPSVFVELGNINHKRDQLRFLMDDNRQAVANWLYEGLVRDFGNNK